MDLNQQPTLQSPTNLRKESVDDDPLSMFLDNDDEEEEEVDNNNNSNNNNNISYLHLHHRCHRSYHPVHLICLQQI